MQRNSSEERGERNFGFRCRRKKMLYIVKDSDKVTCLFSMSVTDKWFHITFTW